MDVIVTFVKILDTLQIGALKEVITKTFHQNILRRLVTDVLTPFKN